MDKYSKMAAGMTAEDAAKLFDTGIFNEICRAYMSMALDDAGTDPADKEKAMDALTECFEFTSAEEALNR